MPWDLLNGGVISYDAARIFLAYRAVKTEDEILPTRTIGLVIGRAIDGACTRTSTSPDGLKPVRLNLAIAIRYDFADIFEVKSDDIVRRGRKSLDGIYILCHISY